MSDNFTDDSDAIAVLRGYLAIDPATCPASGNHVVERNMHNFPELGLFPIRLARSSPLDSPGCLTNIGPETTEIAAAFASTCSQPADCMNNPNKWHGVGGALIHPALQGGIEITCHDPSLA